MSEKHLIKINLEEIYGKNKGQNARLDLIDEYVNAVKKIAGEGNDVEITGGAPVWLYLKVAHILHGRARRLTYSSPVTGEVVIFDHDPF